VLVAAVCLVLRRIALPEVRILTTWYDYLLLLITVLPFLTGFFLVQGIGDPDFWLVAHILVGELLLIAIPFTKLYHVVGFFLTRMQLGMDYGIKRGGRRGRGIAW
jgi:nitrate reductase gamma subunit